MFQKKIDLRTGVAQIGKRLRMAKNVFLFAAVLLMASETPALARGFERRVSEVQSDAQSAGSDIHAFAAASIKPVPTGANVHWGFRSLPGGRIEIGGITVKQLMAIAFRVPQSQIVGGPAWIDTDIYSISAVPPDNAPSRTAPQQLTPAEDQRLMLQTLLSDRFGLRFRHTMSDGPLYLLTKGEGSLKLESPKDVSRSPAFVMFMRGNIVDGEARGANVSLKNIVEGLSRDLNTPVEDKTGLSGTYDLHVEPFAPDNESAEFAAEGGMRRLGLALKKTRGPVQSIAIDSIVKPSPN